MNDIKIMALGGLDENGKNMYCVEVEGDILVFDCGFKYPDETMYGIDFVVPDFDYLKKNRSRVKALFLSHGHMDNMGAVNDFVKLFPNVYIYGSAATQLMVKYVLEESNITSDKLRTINDFENISLDKCSVFSIPLTHSAPGHFGFAINTRQGIIFYATDYIFDQAAKQHFSTDIGKLAYLGKQGVLCLLGESLQAAKPGHTSPQHRISSVVSEFLDNASRRAFVMVYSSNISRVQEILDESKAAGRKVVIYGRRLTDLVHRAIDNGVVNFNKRDFLTVFNLEKHQEEEITIIISGERDRPFSGMKRILDGRDKFLSISNKDSVLIAAKPVPNTELEATEITNKLFKTGADVRVLGKKEAIGNHASKEDILLMLNLLNPKYYIPIKGEYRHLIANRNAANIKGMDNEHVLVLDNGEQVVFKDKKLVKKESFKTGDVLVDGSTISEGEVVLKDRELLKENGIVIVSCALNIKGQRIIAGPEIVTRGFIYIKENKEYIEELKAVSKDIIEGELMASSTYNDIQKSLRDNLSKHIYDEKGRRPMIITMLQTI